MVLLLVRRFDLAHHKLVSGGRLVQEATNEAAAAANRQLSCPDAQDKVGVVGVRPSVHYWDEHRLIVVFGRSQAESCKFAFGVETEDSRRDDGSDVDAAQKATQAKATHSSVQTPRAHGQAHVAEGDQEESNAAELVDNSETRCGVILIAR